MELIAIKLALNKAAQAAEYFYLTIYSDCQVAVEVVQSMINDSFDCSRFSLHPADKELIDELQSLVRNYKPYVSIGWVEREKNKAADKLARYARKERLIAEF